MCGGCCRAVALTENESAEYLGIDPATCFFYKNGYEERIVEVASTGDVKKNKRGLDMLKKRLLSIVMLLIIVLSNITNGYAFGFSEGTKDNSLRVLSEESEFIYSNREDDYFSAISNVVSGSAIVLSEDATDNSFRFLSEVSELIQNNWEDNYFSAITLKLGEPVMKVDGEMIEITPAVMDGETLILPIEDIAEAMGESSMKSNTNLRFSTSATLERLGLEAYVRGEIVYITKPFQTKQLVVQTRNSLTLHNQQGAIQSVTNGQGLYLLQYSSEEDTRAAHDALKSNPDVLYALPNRIVNSNSALNDEEENANEQPSESEINSDDRDENAGNNTDEPPTRASEGNIDNALTEDLESRDIDAIKSTADLTPHRTIPLSDRWGSERISADLFKTHLADNNKTDEIIVAVVDSGAELSHQHLSGRLVTGINLVEADQPVSDEHEHGTHVSGTIADCTPENIKIMPIKVLDAYGHGTELQVALGIKHAADNGAKAINLSLGMICAGDECLLEKAIDAAVEKGVAIVAAAGNESADTANVCPAKHDVITVSATDKDDILAYFSNYGDTVDVAAPGVDIYSSVPNNEFTYMSGTSMAAPHITAALAMIILNDDTLTPAQLKDVIRNATVDMGPLGWDRRYGTGIFDFRVFLNETVEVTGISFLEESLELEYTQLNDKYWVYPSFTPENATDKSVAITSSDESVAVIDEDGYLILKNPGTATISYMTKSGKSAQYELNVLGSRYWIDYASETYEGGTGTEQDPYLINSAEQLARLSRQMYIDKNNLSGQYFKLTADIDLSGKEWTPIYYDDTVLIFEIPRGFEGHFDGNYHNIRNMKITESPKPYLTLGLFGAIDRGSVKNLAILDACVDQNVDVDKTGILAGSISEGTEVSNCYTTGKSSGAGFIGTVSSSEEVSVVKNSFSGANAVKAGFISLSTGATISNSYAYGTVSYISQDESYGDASGGGFISRLWALSDNDGIGLYNAFAVNAPSSENGFIAGKAFGIIEKCYYLSINSKGIATDEEPLTTDITAKDLSFFKNKDNFVNGDYWNNEYPWDFENTWAISETINDGLPYLRGFYNTVAEPVITTTPVNVSNVPNNQSVKVTISTGEAGANIFYSLNGSVYKLYTEPLTIYSSGSGANTVTVNAKAVKAGMNDSGITEKKISFAATKHDTDSSGDSGSGSGGGTSNTNTNVSSSANSIIDANGTKLNPNTIDTTKGKYIISVTPKDGAGYVSIPLSVLLALKEKTKNDIPPFILEIVSPYGSYQIPVDIMDRIIGLYDALKSVGMKPEDVSIKITMTDKSDDTSIRKALTEGFKNGKLFSAVDFTVDIISIKTGKTIYKGEAFNKAITRTIRLPQDLKEIPEYWGAFVYGGGKFRFVPHKAVFSDGVWSVSISSFTNSIYVIAENHVTFTDVEVGFWGKEFIEQAAAKNLVAGIGNGLYAPHKDVSRAEFVQMIVNSLNLPEASADTPVYSDVNKSGWYYDSVMRARSAGLLSGFRESNGFKPDKSITREEMVGIIARAAKLAGIVTTMEFIDLSARYEDFNQLDSNYLYDMQLVVKLKIMQGTSPVTFNPKGTVTRAQAPTALINMLKAFKML